MIDLAFVGVAGCGMIVGYACATGFDYFQRWKMRLAHAEQEKRDQQEQLEAEKSERELARAEQAIKGLEALLVGIDSRLTKSSVEERLRQAMDITTKQSKLDIRSNGEELLQYNNLELEKLNILLTIVRDGHDPVITLRFSNGNEQIALSTYIASIQKNLH